MAGWLLAVSRDTELIRVLTRLLMRSGGGQLWAVESAEQARQRLGERDSLPFTILIDDLFLREESLPAVLEEFSWYAPLIVVALPRRQAQLASVVAEGKANFVSRGDYFIPLAAALVERTLRWDREVELQVRSCGQAAIHGAAGQDGDPDGFPMQALRTIGAILDNLEIVMAERSRLPREIARRLGRVADLAFDMKEGLRLLAGCAGQEEANGVGTPTRR
ncbi:MAG TPA: hypothetical protein VNJ12_01845 [Candidatus Dormibacteraeota bacterium]|nr:hypothetical protein [Candidatus Dormibacteraeota bacterium]